MKPKFHKYLIGQVVSFVHGKNGHREVVSAKVTGITYHRNKPRYYLTFGVESVPEDKLYRSAEAAEKNIKH